MPDSVEIIFFLLIVISLFSGIHYYFIRRFVIDTALDPLGKKIAVTIIILLGLGGILTFPFSRILPLNIARPAVFVPYVWMGMILWLVMALFAIDGVRAMGYVVKRLKGQRRIAIARRVFLARILALGVTLTAASLGAAAVWRASAAPEVVPVRVTLKKLPPELSGFTIAQITDLHIGPILDNRWLKDVVDRVNRLQPDMIAITGDLVDGSVDRLKDQVAPLRDLSAPSGTYFVTGNHEYYSGASDWVAAIKKMGISVLQNERVSIGRGEKSFDLAGIDDASARRTTSTARENLARALKGRDRRQELILLAHNPRVMYDAGGKGIGLVLCGHTHAGQIWPFVYFVGIGHPYTRGLHAHDPQTQVYVNQGTGFWGPPMRLGTHSEITHITLMSANK
ncbi:MAG: metallophosphoesterase [Myxococcota bacterium]|nr:metallophosphoesterase [Myxococcota bacterium]